MAITTTPSAASHIQSYLNNRPRGVGITVGVKTTGCSGMAYVIEFADSIPVDHEEFVSNGVRVFISKKAMPYIDGTELDYAREGLNEGFKFNNPNVKNECGCGESFNI